MSFTRLSPFELDVRKEHDVADVTRIPLKADFSRSHVQRVASRNRWLIWNIIQPGPNNPYEMIWLFDKRDDEPEETAMHYIEDERLQIRYMAVTGKERDRVVKQMYHTMHVYTRDEVKAMVITAVTPTDYIRAIYHVAVIANPAVFDPELFELYQTVLAHADSEVRFAALSAITYTDWREFQDILRHMKEHDPDEQVRQRAGILLDSFSIDFDAQPNAG